MPRPPLIRSMFLRRLTLLGVAFGVGGLVLVSQAVRLSVVQGAEMLAVAERRMVVERWTPTVRGRILDRKNRVLAVDEPAFDVMVEYDLITGAWADAAAASEARRRHREDWPRLDRAQRSALIDAVLPEMEAEQDRVWAELAAALGLERATLETRRVEIRDSVERLADQVWQARLEARRRELNRDRELGVEVTLEDVAQPLREHVSAHAVATGVDEETAFRVRRIGATHEGVSLQKGARRVYPHETVTVEIDRSTFPEPLREARGESAESVTVEGVATHLLGWMRGVYREDVERRPRVDPGTGEIDPGHYRPGDTAGRFGVEESQEGELRGLRGRIVLHRNTRLEEVTDPVPGRDVRLTIDVMLQARIRAIMDPAVGLATAQAWHAGRQGLPQPVGTPLNGAAVVLDIDTGETLALVSTPSFTRDQVRRDASSVFGDRLDFRWVNRAIAKPYMPGSPMKPVVLAAAVTEGVHDLDTPIESTGYLFPDQPNRYRSWLWKQYGATFSERFGRPLYADDALCVSCNIYFYTLGMNLGPERLMGWFGRFGIGQGFGLGVGAEYPGNPGVKHNGDPTYLGDAILMGIGQGPMAWTPLHAADAYATLVRGGQRIMPRVLKDRAPVVDDLRLDPESIDACMAGLSRAVHDDWGTGHAITYPSGRREPIFEIEGVEVWGKTGTAQTSPIVGEDPDGPEGPESAPVLRAGDHAWFVVLAGREGAMPRYAIAVVIEHAGSGGRVSGPIAAQVVRALRAEGYL